MIARPFFIWIGLLVMPGHSRLKDGVASARLCPGIHVLAA